MKIYQITQENQEKKNRHDGDCFQQCWGTVYMVCVHFQYGNEHKYNEKFRKNQETASWTVMSNSAKHSHWGNSLTLKIVHAECKKRRGWNCKRIYKNRAAFERAGPSNAELKQTP